MFCISRLSRSAIPSLLRLAVLAGGYIAAGWVSLHWLSIPSGAPLVWLPAGVTSAAALLMGWRALPGLALGGLLMAALGQGGELGGPLLPCLDAAVIALLAPRLLPSKQVFGSAFNLLMFQLAAGAGDLVQAPLLNSPSQQVMVALLGGHILLGPWLATCLRPHGRRDLRASLSLESGAALIAVLLAGLLLTSRITPVLSALPGFTMLPALLWASFRLPAPAASTIQLLAGLILVIAQAPGGSTGDPAVAFQALRLAAGTVLMSQLVLAVTQERRRMQRHLQRQANRLQLLVRLRTQELAEANRKLQNLSERDGLTGIANRRHFDAVLQREWRRALRRSEPLTVGLIDVDHFKAYNDRHGHLLGDETLRQVATTLDKVAGRAEDLVARYGGEEFAVILPGLDRHDAHLMAERLRAAIADLAIPHEGGGVDGRITISGGLVSWVPQAHGRPIDVLEAADRLLYAAKARGRNRVLVQAAAIDRDVSSAAS